MQEDIKTYHDNLEAKDKAICDLLFKQINDAVPSATCKVWHNHPVWFINENPIVGYAKRKNHVQLLFWSGRSFDEPELAPEGTFKAAQAHYTTVDQIYTKDLQRWLTKSVAIQWDYKNIVKRRGVLERLV